MEEASECTESYLSDNLRLANESNLLRIVHSILSSTRVPIW